MLGQTPPPFDAALEGARQVARRSGLYLSGDFGAAVRSTLAEIGEAQAVAGSSPNLAAICLELCRDGAPPEIIFGWSHESPLAANLNLLLLGEGNVPWMVKELVRKALPGGKRQPRVLIG